MRKIAVAILFALTITTVPLHASEGGGGGGGGGGDNQPEAMSTFNPNVMLPPRKAPPKLPAGNSTKFSDGSAVTFSGSGLRQFSVTTSSGNTLSGSLIKDDTRDLVGYFRTITFRADYGAVLVAYFHRSGMDRIEKVVGRGKPNEKIWSR